MTNTETHIQSLKIAAGLRTIFNARTNRDLFMRAAEKALSLQPTSSCLTSVWVAAMNINKGHDWDHANKSGRHAVLAALDTYDRQIASREG